MRMGEEALTDFLKEGLWTAFVVSLPILVAALVVGLAIGLIQALTSVQELTLTFVPKLGGIVIMFWVSMGFMTRTLITFFENQVLPGVSGS